MPQGGYGGGTAPISNKKVIPKKKVAPQAYRNPEASTVDYYKDKFNEAAKGINAQIPTYQDPFNGVNPLQALLQGLNPSGGRSGGGGGRSRGGGGGSGGPSAADVAARNKAIDDMLAQEYGSLDTLGASQHAAYDARNTQLQGIQAGADQRLTGILGGLQQGAQATQGTTQQAFNTGDAQLQQLLSQYQQMAHARDATNNTTLGAFGAGQVNPTGSGVEDLISAGRVNNQMQGQAYNQLYASRGNMYNGLGADARMQNGQTFDALLAKLAQERAATDQQNAAQRAQYGIQAAQARMP